MNSFSVNKSGTTLYLVIHNTEYIVIHNIELTSGFLFQIAWRMSTARSPSAYVTRSISGVVPCTLVWFRSPPSISIRDKRFQHYGHMGSDSLQFVRHIPIFQENLLYSPSTLNMQEAAAFKIL
jgi:hypothetical protein